MGKQSAEPEKALRVDSGVFPQDAEANPSATGSPYWAEPTAQRGQWVQEQLFDGRYASLADLLHEAEE